ARGAEHDGTADRSAPKGGRGEGRVQGRGTPEVRATRRSGPTVAFAGRSPRGGGRAARHRGRSGASEPVKKSPSLGFRGPNPPKTRSACGPCGPALRGREGISDSFTASSARCDDDGGPAGGGSGTAHRGALRRGRRVGTDARRSPDPTMRRA